MIDQHQLLTELRPRLRTMARGMLSVNEYRYVDDMAQEAWIAVWRALPTIPATITTPDELTAWCVAVARNSSRNFIRSELLAQKNGGPGEAKVKDKLPSTLLYGGYQELINEVWDGAAAAETVTNAYHAGRVAQAIDLLPPRQREYVIERFWYGRSTTELHHGPFSPASWTQAKKRLRSSLADLIPA